MSRILAIAATNFRRTLRDRLGLFFIIVLPIVLIIVLGITYGGQGNLRVGVTDLDRSHLSAELVAAIGPDDETRIEIREYGTVAELEDAVARGLVNVGLSIAAGYEDELRNGGTASVDYVLAPTTAASAVKATVEQAVAAMDALVRAARFTSARTGVTFEAALEAARASQSRAPGVAVTTASVADSAVARPSGFSIGAQSQVILFMFLTSLTGATELIVTRQLGVSRRMFSTPTSTTEIILGEGAGRLALALFEGGFIVLASALLFGVDWGNPAGTAAIVIVFAFVSAGAALLVGAVSTNPSQAGALGPALGMGLGLLGGTMVPMEIFPEIMRTAGHVTPHAWAMDAFRALLFQGADLPAILPQLAILAGFAAVLLALAGLRFRRLLATGAI
ncbi:MAG: ABC transporter permease [Chloroflexota bacterium]